MLVQANQSFRSSSKNPLERKSVEDSFAKSILWGFTVAAESPGRVLVDATDFFLRDVVKRGNEPAAGQLPRRSHAQRVLPAQHAQLPEEHRSRHDVDVRQRAGRRRWRRRRRSDPGPGADRRRPAAVVAAAVRRRAVLGLGRQRDAVAGCGDACASTCRSSSCRTSPRSSRAIDDPRAGYGGTTFVDFSQPIGEPIQFRYIRRHRLQKKDPSAAISEPVKPIQYWVDSGAPEDVKKALVEGASWWNQAFEAAGFRNAFKVDVLPDGADPMDIRYNMINWVHRSTRGWSSGGSVSDPRTGEIIKATVTLGSLRDRQDYMIFEGLLSPYANGNERPAVLYETALQRIRQLSAHEVGHTLGLGHNYYDSSKGWISVMDYPHRARGAEGRRHASISRRPITRTSASGTRSRSTSAIASSRTAATTKPRSTKILDRCVGARTCRYFTNQDTDIHPKADQWTNGANQTDELTRLMKVRRAALDRIGANTIRTGVPTVMIEEPLVPIYMYHRYAVESTASTIGGQDFVYAMRGDSRTPVEWVKRRNAAQGDRRADRDAQAVGADDSEDGSSICCRRGRPATGCIASCSRARPAKASIRSTRRRSPRT